MIIRNGVLALGLIFGLIQISCTGDDSDDDSSNGINRTHSPTGEAIPASFTNTAASLTEFNSQSDKVNTEIIGAASVALGISGGAQSGLKFLEGDSASSSIEVNVDLAPFMTEVAANADCSPYFSFMGSRLKTLLGVLNYYKSTTASFGASGDLSAISLFYDVEDLKADSGNKFVFHMRLTPKAGIENPLAKLGILTVGGGATDKEMAMQFGIANKVDTEQVKLDLSTSYDMYANTETKTLQLGLAYSVSQVTAGGEPVGMKLKTDITLVGGESPSLTTIMDFDGTDKDGNKVPGNIRYQLAKTGADTYTLAWSGGYIDRNVDKTLQITKTATGCTVTAVQ